MKALWRWLLGESDSGAGLRAPGVARRTPSADFPSHEAVGPEGGNAGVQPSVDLLQAGSPATGGAILTPGEAISVLATQSRLASAAENLVPALQGIPELVRHQSKATEAILHLTTQARDRDALLANALSEFERGADRQSQLLHLIQQQLDLNQVTNTTVAESLRDASIALGAYAGTSERHTRAIEALLEATRRRTRRADQMEHSLQTWMIITTALCTACLAYSMYLAYRSGSTTSDPERLPAEVTAVTSVSEVTADGTSPAGSAPSTAPTMGEPEDGEPTLVRPAEEGRDKAPPVPKPTGGAAATGTNPERVPSTPINQQP